MVGYLGPCPLCYKYSILYSQQCIYAVIPVIFNLTNPGIPVIAWNADNSGLERVTDNNYNYETILLLLTSLLYTTTYYERLLCDYEGLCY